MEQIIIQYGVTQGNVAELLRSNDKEVFIGRGFDNTLVIQDDYIGPKQLRIFQTEDNSWWMDVLNQTNDVILNGKVLEANDQQHIDSVQIHSGDKITIGRTTLSVYAENHQVEKTRKLLNRSLNQRSSGFIFPIILMCLFLAFDFTKYYLLTSDGSVDRYIILNLGSAMLVGMWLGLWGIVGRIVRRNSHFGQQFIAAIFILFMLSILSPWASVMEFNFSNETVSTVFNYALAFLAMSLMLKFNLLFATNIRRTNLVAVSITGLIIGAVVSYQVYIEDEFIALADYSETVKPHFMYLGQSESMDQYLAEIQDAMQEVDGLAKKTE